ncbi:MAG TPA: hypothetical protein VFY85_12865 [Gemmatimonadaceae bacterium]|nr:hypothetical protein [Gemmatimonadaceae bacterium]
MSPHKILVRAAITGAILAIAACTGDVLAPTSQLNGVRPAPSRGRDVLPARGGTGNASASGANAASSGAPVPVSCGARRMIQASGTFGPAGGILTFGNSSLVIPGGALRDTVTISATQLDDGSSTVRFEPHGLHFYKPAGLVLDGTGCALPADEAPSIVYLGDAGEVLETIPAYYDPHWRTVAAPIEHFSGYAIAFRDER